MENYVRRADDYVFQWSKSTDLYFVERLGNGLVCLQFRKSVEDIKDNTRISQIPKSTHRYV